MMIVIVLVIGSRTHNTYSEPYSRTDSLIDLINYENQLLLTDTSFLNPYTILVFDLPEVEIRYKPTILIQSDALTTKSQLTGFLLSNNPKLDKHFVSRIIDAYITDCAIEGINHDIAFSQMCLETGFLRFNGSVKPEQYNFCGLGAVGKENSGASFESIEVGIRAHIQHLKAYASQEPLSTKLVDTRFAFVKRGIAPDIHSLAGTWASDLNYGFKMEAIIRSLKNTHSAPEILASGV
jgi:hypothetical protein